MRIFVFSFLSMLAMSLFGQKGYQPTSSSVVIDGSDDEWTVGEHLFDRDAQLTYAFRKDAENLYVLVRTNLQQTLQQVLVSGLEIWVHPDGKKRRTYGLMYPMPTDPGQLRQAGTMQQLFQKEQTQIVLTNLFGDERGAIQADLKMLDQPIHVKHQMHDDGYWVYELGIPLSAFPKAKKNKQNLWQIGISTPDLEDLDDIGGGGMPGSRMNDLPGGPGGAGAMGMPGGGIGGPPPSGRSGPKALRVWTRIQM